MRDVANFLLNFAITSKPRCADKLNISFVPVTRFGSVCHRKEYESHEVFCAASKQKGLKGRFFFSLVLMTKRMAQKKVRNVECPLFLSSVRGR
ncbi:MAG TPA: hypothetical protein VGW77_29415 [Candidatus Binatia bacterium]|jgi:hypothetical protein|nr:hypothetical protein [Candidatus Binatia bacterium]